MKRTRFFIKSLFFVFLLLNTIIFGSVIYLDDVISDNFKIKKGDTLNFDTIIPVTAEFQGAKLSQEGLVAEIGEEFDVELKILGLIPLTTANVEVVDELHVAVLGTPFGMKLYTQGVLVVDITAVESGGEVVNPAKDAGIKVGDYVISVNGTEVNTNEDLSDVVEESQGKELCFKVLRKKETLEFNFSPALSDETGTYKVGLWVRDSTAGIGTLTFYSPVTEVVCGLGHGICDEDTGTLLNLNSGEIVTAEIISVEKGVTGSPGQLKGKFTYKTIGDIDLNCSMGVYSLLKGELDVSNLTEIALKQEVCTGKAQLLCTVEGTEPKLYDCEISLRTSAYMSKTQNMIVTITDKELLEATGGIVQGLSGSPILQNGKLVGAITHVLVDDPTKGYGIFAENMLETAQSVEEEQKLKEAS